MLRSNSKCLENHVVSPKKKKKGCSGKDLQKRKVLSHFPRYGDNNYFPCTTDVAIPRPNLLDL